MKISIITATYNREHLLPRLYDSINKNYETFKNIEWIVVDDGSTDNTKDLVNKYIKESKYNIKYYYQENSGKMNAINNGMNYVTGDIIIEMDSDDYFTSDCFLTISKDYENLDNNVYGIAYKKVINNNSFDISSLESKIVKLFDIHNIYGYDFDMMITFKASIRKQYKYELEHNEKFITEARLYYKLDNIYNGLLFKNKDIVIVEYQSDGYSNNIKNIYKKYPYGFYEYFKECISYINNKVLFKKKLYFIKHYILFSYLTNKSIKECISSCSKYKLLVTLLVIPGYIKSKNF